MSEVQWESKVRKTHTAGKMKDLVVLCLARNRVERGGVKCPPAVFILLQQVACNVLFGGEIRQ